MLSLGIVGWGGRGARRTGPEDPGREPAPRVHTHTHFPLPVRLRSYPLEPREYQHTPRRRLHRLVITRAPHVRDGTQQLQGACSWLTMYTSILAILLFHAVMGDPGRWDHHRRRGRQRATKATTTTTPPPPPPPTTRKPSSWRHGLTLHPPAHRCQVSSVLVLGDGRPVNKDYVSSVNELLLEDKLLLAPVVFEGTMVSRTNTYKGLYFVSFKVLRVVKGQLHPQLYGHIRLLFQTGTHGSTPRAELRGNACPPVPFSVRSGRKYLIFVKKISVGRYVAVAEPEIVRQDE